MNADDNQNLYQDGDEDEDDDGTAFPPLCLKHLWKMFISFFRFYSCLFVEKVLVYDLD